MAKYLEKNEEEKKKGIGTGGLGKVLAFPTDETNICSTSSCLFSKLKMLEFETT